MDMALPGCPYCRELFTPSRYPPDQVVCSGRECQRQRRFQSPTPFKGVMFLEISLGSGVAPIVGVEPFDPIYLICLVGAGRFERPTPCAQGRCATRLRYAPTVDGLFILNHFLTRRTP